MQLLEFKCDACFSAALEGHVDTYVPHHHQVGAVFAVLFDDIPGDDEPDALFGAIVCPHGHVIADPMTAMCGGLYLDDVHTPRGARV